MGATAISTGQEHHGSKHSGDPLLFSRAIIPLFDDWCNQKDLQVLYYSQP